ncbi:MAG: ketopantoate reductase family protein [Blastocatellia bacterium]
MGKRYIIHGAGAVGGLLGGRLAETGADVILIARAPVANAIRANGLTIRTPQGDSNIRNITAVTSPVDITPGDGDIILLTVKSGQTQQAIQQLRETFDRDTPVFCAQNGVRNEEIAGGRFRRIHGMMVSPSVTMLEPGVIAHTNWDALALGAWPLGFDETTNEVAQDLADAGFTVTTHRAVMAVKWAKLLLNLNNAMHAITGQWVQLTLVEPEYCQFMAEVIEEGLRALTAAGISIEAENSPVDVAGRLAHMRGIREDKAVIAAAQNLAPELRIWPSTLIDLQNQRGEVETGYLNAEIMLLGEKTGVPTPYNTVLYNVVEQMAMERQAPGKYSLADLRDMVAQQIAGPAQET